MGPLQLYEVQVDGYTTRMRLNAADAKRLGGVPLNPPEPRAAAAPKRKRRTSANKSRRPATKSTAAGG